MNNLKLDGQLSEVELKWGGVTLLTPSGDEIRLTAIYESNSVIDIFAGVRYEIKPKRS